jgi:hypothetical protein
VLKREALARRTKVIQWLNLAMEEGSIPIKIDGFPQELLNLIAFVDSRPQPSEDAIEELAAQLFDRNTMNGVDLRLVALNGLKQRCKTELARLIPPPAAAQKQVSHKQEETGAREQQWRDALYKIRERDRQILARVEFIAASESRQLIKRKR